MSGLRITNLFNEGITLESVDADGKYLIKFNFKKKKNQN